MKRILLGITGIEVSELSFGTLIFSKFQADMSPEEARPSLTRALELGINFFDTAQSYGTQNHLHLAIASTNSEVIIATKTRAKTRKEARKAYEESVRELGRERIDIYLLHLVDSAEDLTNRREALDFFIELKKTRQKRDCLPLAAKVAMRQEKNEQEKEDTAPADVRAAGGRAHKRF